MSRPIFPGPAFGVPKKAGDGVEAGDPIEDDCPIPIPPPDSFLDLEIILLSAADKELALRLLFGALTALPLRVFAESFTLPLDEVAFGIFTPLRVTPFEEEPPLEEGILVLSVELTDLLTLLVPRGRLPESSGRRFFMLFLFSFLVSSGILLPLLRALF